ncbi:DUF6221 family protein [Streptomyces albidoflavus]
MGRPSRSGPWLPRAPARRAWPTLRVLAQSYAGHPDHREEWRP